MWNLAAFVQAGQLVEANQHVGGGEAVVLVSTGGKLNLSPRHGEMASPLTSTGYATPPGLQSQRGLAVLPRGETQTSSVDFTPPCGAVLSQGPEQQTNLFASLSLTLT